MRWIRRHCIELVVFLLVVGFGVDVAVGLVQVADRNAKFRTSCHKVGGHTISVSNSHVCVRDIDGMYLGQE